MTDLPSDVVVWMVAGLAGQLYRMRRRALAAERSRDLWRSAAEARERRIDELVDEVNDERARTEALHAELVRLNTILHTLRDTP